MTCNSVCDEGDRRSARGRRVVEHHALRVAALVAAPGAAGVCFNRGGFDKEGQD